MTIFEWIERELHPAACTSDRFIYDDMESQSGRCLPIIYEPFDATQRHHWHDRGSAFDFLYSTGSSRLLDFGPGDGWPSLIVAPFVEEVIGVDASLRRVKVCTQNAARLGLANASFIHVPHRAPLPFRNDHFDGVMAASSIEETAAIPWTLGELFRVLKPQGRLRISYDGLARYRDGREQEASFIPLDENSCRLILTRRNIEQEQLTHYGLTLALSLREATPLLPHQGGRLSYPTLTVSLLEKLRPVIIDARACILPHPSGATFAALLTEAGFHEIIPSHSGAAFAGRLYDVIPPQQRPGDLEGVDTLLRPLMKVIIEMRAPLDIDPMITAIK